MLLWLLLLLRGHAGDNLLRRLLLLHILLMLLINILGLGAGRCRARVHNLHGLLLLLRLLRRLLHI
jgi:hypothetical protein